MSASENPFSEYSNISDSDLKVGVEIEFPKNDDGDDYHLKAPGAKTNTMCEDARSGTTRWRNLSDFGVMHYDGTVGAEIVNPDPIDLDDAPKFYDETIEIAAEEYNTFHEPTGTLKGGSTAGLHMHLSSITEEQARKLAEFSMQPWMQVFACSAVVEMGNPEMPVFRGENYCNLVTETRGSRYNVVNHRGNGHYEWRLPEPMTPEHFRHLCKFLRIFEDSPEQAKEYVMWVLRRREDEVTSIARAKNIGMPTDFDSLPLVSSSRHPETAQFYNDISRGGNLPNIYRVTYEGQDFYAFDTSNDDIENREFRIGGIGYRPVEFTVDDVFYADNLDPIEEEDVVDPVLSAVENRSEYQSHGDRSETEATKTLKDVIDKDF